jgi:hypothetical protein
MSTLAQLRTNVRSMGNFVANDTRVTDTVVNREINRGLRRIALRHNWPWLQKTFTINTVQGQTQYALPVDFLKLISLRHSAHPIENLYQRNIIELDEYTGGQGRPMAFAIYGGYLTVAFMPAGQFKMIMRYISQEQFLVADTDAPLLPDYWEDGLYDTVLIQLYRMTKQLDEAALAETRFELWLKETAHNIRQSEANPRIRVRPGSPI